MASWADIVMEETNSFTGNDNYYEESTSNSSRNSSPINFNTQDKKYQYFSLKNRSEKLNIPQSFPPEHKAPGLKKRVLNYYFNEYQFPIQAMLLIDPKINKLTGKSKINYEDTQVYVHQRPEYSTHQNMFIVYISSRNFHSLKDAIHCLIPKIDDIYEVNHYTRMQNHGDLVIADEAESITDKSSPQKYNTEPRAQSSQAEEIGWIRQSLSNSSEATECLVKGTQRTSELDQLRKEQANLKAKLQDIETKIKTILDHQQHH